MEAEREVVESPEFSTMKSIGALKRKALHWLTSACERGVFDRSCILSSWSLLIQEYTNAGDVCSPRQQSFSFGAA